MIPRLKSFEKIGKINFMKKLSEDFGVQLNQNEKIQKKRRKIIEIFFQIEN
jgi:2-phosphoglycerate kinase